MGRPREVIASHTQKKIRQRPTSRLPRLFLQKTNALSHRLLQEGHSNEPKHLFSRKWSEAKIKFHDSIRPLNSDPKMLIFCSRKFYYFCQRIQMFLSVCASRSVSMSAHFCVCCYFSHVSPTTFDTTRTWSVSLVN